jgi:hypothetical protein
MNIFIYIFTDCPLESMLYTTACIFLYLIKECLRLFLVENDNENPIPPKSKIPNVWLRNLV